MGGGLAMSAKMYVRAELAPLRRKGWHRDIAVTTGPRLTRVHDKRTNWGGSAARAG